MIYLIIFIGTILSLFIFGIIKTAALLLVGWSLLWILAKALVLDE